MIALIMQKASGKEFNKSQEVILLLTLLNTVEENHFDLAEGADKDDPDKNVY
ncbi:MAG: hypothetical protein R2831_05100 [Chitinophagaceae bacterium]